MFNKDKGRVWLFVNAVLLFTVIISTISLLVKIIFQLLPENGDYSSLVLNNFLYEILGILFLLVMVVATLYIINKVINLFDSSYALSRKILNVSFLFSLINCSDNLFKCILSNILDVNYSDASLNGFIANIVGSNFNGVFIKNLIALMFVTALALFVINIKPIMVKENSKVQNFINFISIQACIYSFYFFIFSIINNRIYNSPVDLVRTVIIDIIIFAVFAIAIYWINFRNKFNNNPEAFNTSK